MAYGSNLCTERFACYLQGGRPAGATRAYQPCPTGRSYRDSQPTLLDRRLRFGPWSATWMGGVAVLDHQPINGHRTYGRAYLLTVAQLLHVARQENRQHSPLPPLDPSRLEGNEAIALDVPATCLYRMLLPVGRLDGRPMLTITGPAGDRRRREPSPAYRAIIVNGLRETWPELTPAMIADYLATALGP